MVIIPTGFLPISASLFKTAMGIAIAEPIKTAKDIQTLICIVIERLNERDQVLDKSRSKQLLRTPIFVTDDPS
jgi:hypothetical protein